MPEMILKHPGSNTRIRLRQDRIAQSPKPRVIIRHQSTTHLDPKLKVTKLGRPLHRRIARDRRQRNHPPTLPTNLEPMGSRPKQINPLIRTPHRCS